MYHLHLTTFPRRPAPVGLRKMGERARLFDTGIPFYSQYHGFGTSWPIEILRFLLWERNCLFYSRIVSKLEFFLTTPVQTLKARASWWHKKWRYFLWFLGLILYRKLRYWVTFLALDFTDFLLGATGSIYSSSTSTFLSFRKNVYVTNRDTRAVPAWVTYLFWLTWH